MFVCVYLLKIGKIENEKDKSDKKVCAFVCVCLFFYWRKKWKKKKMLSRESCECVTSFSSLHHPQVDNCVGCVAIDVEELPSELRSPASGNTPLLAYKYLQTDYTLQLSIKKHGE